MKTKTLNQQPTKDDIKKDLIDLGLSQRDLARIHRRTPQQIYSALNGEQPGLLNRILKYINKRKNRSNHNE